MLCNMVSHSYAFLVHGMGPAVGGQGFSFDSDSTKTSSNILIENNVIEDIQCWNKEIPGMCTAQTPMSAGYEN